MDEILLQRIFDKLDSMDAKISDLCNRMTKSEVYHEAQSDFRSNEEDNNKWGWEKLFGSVGVMIAIVAVVLTQL